MSALPVRSVRGRSEAVFFSLYECTNGLVTLLMADTTWEGTFYDMTRTHCPEQRIYRYDSAGYLRVHTRRYICSSWTVDAFSSLGREDYIKSANPACVVPRGFLTFPARKL